MPNYNDDFLTDEQFQALPYSQATEQALVSVLLLDGMSAFVDVRDICSPDHFFGPLEHDIAKAIWSRLRLELPVDPIVIKQRFERRKDNDLDIVAYLTLLAENAPSAGNSGEYAKIVADLAYKRRIAIEAHRTLALVMDEYSDETADAIHSALDKRMGDIAGEFAAPDRFVSLKDASKEVIGSIGQSYAMGLSTGIPDLDEAMSGLHRGDLYFVAGRPGMFKTGFAYCVGQAVAKTDLGEGPGRVGIFSLEMSAKDNAIRALSAEIGDRDPISYQNIRKHYISEREKGRLEAALETVPNILIDETPGITISVLEKRARAMKKELGGLDLIIIDYLQLMGDADVRGRSDTRAAALTTITSRLKSLSKSLNVPILCLAQVLRSVEHRENKRPLSSDIKDSGSIEQDADAVLVLYREEYYKQKEAVPDDPGKAMQHDADLQACKGIMEIILRKQRFGPEQTVKVRVNLGSNLIMPYTAGAEDYAESMPF